MFLFVGILVACQPRERVIDYPAFQAKNSASLEISRIVLNDTATIIYADVEQFPGGWARVDSGIYILANGQKNLALKSEGLKLSEKFEMRDTGLLSFKLFFPPLPRGVNSIDLIESRMNLGGWHVWGLNLNPDVEVAAMAVPSDVSARDWKEATTLPPAELKTGKTRVKVRLCGYRDLMDGRDVELFVSDMFSPGKELSKRIDKDLSCTFEFDQYSTTWVYLSNTLFHTMIVLDPGDDVEVYVDLEEATRRASRYQKDRMKAHRLAYVVGESRFIPLNYALQDEYEDGFSMYSFYEDINGMNADEYIAYVMKLCRAEMDRLANDKALPDGVRKYREIAVKGFVMRLVCSGESNLETAYREANHIGWDQREIDFKAPEFTDKHFAVLKDLDVNRLDMLYARDFPYCFDIVGYRIPSLNRLEKILGNQEGFLIDYFKLQGIYEQLENMKPLTKEQQRNLASIDPYYTKAFEQVKQQIDAKVAESKVKAGKRIREVPSVSEKKLFDAIMARYKGKVVMVDLWATWCGPCRGAIASFEPRKNKFKDKDVVFVYITNESSPESKWLEMVAGIEGEHYRLNRKQWDYICDYFGVDGIPSYVIVDRDGNARLRNDLRGSGMLEQELSGML